VPSVTRTLIDLRETIRNSSVDVVHAHLGISQLLAAMSAPLHLPIISSRRGRTPPLERSSLGRGSVAIANRRTRLLVCNSEDLARRARTEPWTPPIEIVPNGVDLSRFAPMSMPSGPPTVVVVARMRPEKGHELFLRAFRLTRERVPAARAILVGDGPSSDAVQALISALDLQDAVTAVGGVDDPRPYLAKAHLVALASPHEGFPNSLLEAMACGRPVVATAVGGVPELVEDGMHGRLSPVAVEPFSEALVGLLGSPEVARAMGLNARDRACRYSWDRVVERMERIYRAVSADRSITNPAEVA
jgi:glycosyltransferase involved in cell wall biosynthesis